MRGWQQWGGDQGWLVGSLVLTSAIATLPASAQVVPDGTVNSQVSTVGTVMTINGGTGMGGNLFHSFQQFSVPTGSTVRFNNSPQVQTILARVTGGAASLIDGVIQTNGTANLFLINPQGILFGPNASLNVGGSFIASTASSVWFADGTQFSATQPQANPLLTVSVPIGLQLGTDAGEIRVQGAGHTLAVTDPIFSSIAGAGKSTRGLRVPPGKTLGLLGGSVVLDGGVVTAPGGNVAIASVNNGTVGLVPTGQGWRFDATQVQGFRDLQFSHQALVDASGAGMGLIQLQGDHISLSEGSLALVQNQGSQTAGGIQIQAATALAITGTTWDGRLRSSVLSETIAAGNSGDTWVQAPQVKLQDGGEIANRSFSAARGGNIQIQAAQFVEVSGTSPLNASANSDITASTYRAGAAGNVTISTAQLRILEGAVVSSIVFGTGAGGNVTANADTVTVAGASSRTFQPSALASSTFNAGAAGSVNVNTQRLVVREGARVSASTLATGAAGSVNLHATESIQVSGKTPGAVNPTLVGSAVTLVNRRTQQTFRLPAVPSGASGDVTITTPVLEVTDGALVSVRNDGKGNAGVLHIQADTIVLNQQGSITAATASGEGGNLHLQVGQQLVLRHNSLISATAGGTGNGGNLTIAAPFIVASASENSDIVANAFAGRGGNIQITAQGIYGLQARPTLTPLSDITASSELGLNGVVQVTAPRIALEQDVLALPTTPVDVEGLVKTGCGATANRPQSEFRITGRGGLPPTPIEPLSADPILPDLGRLEQGEAAKLPGQAGQRPDLQPDLPLQNPPVPVQPPMIVEAQGWQRDASGQLSLIAPDSVRSAYHPWQTSPTCQQAQRS